MLGVILGQCSEALTNLPVVKAVENVLQPFGFYSQDRGHREYQSEQMFTKFTFVQQGYHFTDVCKVLSDILSSFDFVKSLREAVEKKTSKIGGVTKKILKIGLRGKFDLEPFFAFFPHFTCFWVV